MPDATRRNTRLLLHKLETEQTQPPPLIVGTPTNQEPEQEPGNINDMMALAEAMITAATVAQFVEEYQGLDTPIVSHVPTANNSE